MELTIKQKFRDLIPPLHPEELKELERSILAEGCRDPLVTWREVVIDGHHRYEICRRHGKPFATVEKVFEDDRHAMLWMARNQKGRRNLPDIDRIALARVEAELLSDINAEKQKQEGKERGKEGGRGKKKLFLCECGESFSGEVWHCQECGHHWPLDKTACCNCQADRKPLPQNCGKGLRAPTTSKTAAKSAGVGERTYDAGKLILDAAQKGEIEKDVVDKIRHGETTIHAVAKELKNRIKRTKSAEKLAEWQAKPIEEKKSQPVNLILADPPWQYDFAETESRAIENHYQSATVAEIVKHFEDPRIPVTAKNCTLLLWATAPKLLEAIEVMKAWGFEYKTHAIWDKQKIGMGYWFRGQHELLLVGTRGKVSPPEDTARVGSVFSEARGRHSAKPACVYEWIEAAFPMHSKLEMYCRKAREGWQVFGNEA